MEFKDYYRTLNVSPEAGAEDIKKAFRRLALQYHPDRNPGNTAEAEARFKEINEAYEILGNEHKRWQYDKMMSRPGYVRTAFNVEDFFNSEISEERYQKILRKFAGMDFIIRGMGWGKPWGCGGDKCRRQWRQDVE